MLTRLALDSVVFYFYWSKDRITRVKLESAVHKDNTLSSILILSSSENVFNSLILCPEAWSLTFQRE